MSNSDFIVTGRNEKVPRSVGTLVFRPIEFS